MGILREKKNNASLAASSCADLRTAFNRCFYRWYSEKFLKGQWDKDDCAVEWRKYKDCLSQHLDDKHLSRFLDTDGVEDYTYEGARKSSDGVSS